MGEGKRTKKYDNNQPPHDVEDGIEAEQITSMSDYLIEVLQDKAKDEQKIIDNVFYFSIKRGGTVDVLLLPCQLLQRVTVKNPSPIPLHKILVPSQEYKQV